MVKSKDKKRALVDGPTYRSSPNLGTTSTFFEIYKIHAPVKTNWCRLACQLWTPTVGILITVLLVYLFKG